MSKPRYIVDRRVGAPPEKVLATIGEKAGSARRSTLPLPLRREMRGLRGKVRGQRFTVRFDEIFDGDGTDLHGWVLPDGDGQARVHARVQGGRHTGVAVLGLLALAGVVTLRGARDGWMIAALAAALWIISTVRRAGGFMNHEQAAYLSRWLHGVLDGLPAASPAPPASTGSGAAAPSRAS
jgi:hypothetical protein